MGLGSRISVDIVIIKANNKLHVNKTIIKLDKVIIINNR
jgi:hypothetical protein